MGYREDACTAVVKGLEDIGLATIGYLQPKNLLLIILDNERCESTGGQHTCTTRLDLAAIAAGCGPRAWQTDDLEGLKASMDEAVKVPGAGLIRMKSPQARRQCP